VIAKVSALGSQTHPAPPLRSGTCLNQAVFFANGSITSSKKSLQEEVREKKKAPVETRADTKTNCF
jgi:hypothetical protein